MVRRKQNKKKSFRFRFKGKITSRDITMLTRQMATLVSAGIPLIQAFSVVEETMIRTPLCDVIQNIKRDVESGTPLSSALKKYPNAFSALYCSMIETGEQSGTLDTMLDRLASHYENIECLTRKIKNALYYPIAVIIIAIMVTLLLLLKVVPTFQQLFNDFGAPLPAFTQWILTLSHILQDYAAYLLCFSIIMVSMFYYFYHKNKFFHHTLQRRMLKLPLFGSLLQKSAIARITRTLSTTLRAGLPLSEALDTVATASGNVVYAEAIFKIKAGLVAGQQMRSMMKKTHVFPNLVIQMVGIGEESGRLEAMLEKIAHLYQDEVTTQINGLTTLLEPLIMVILGIVIGGLVIAMYLPIFQIGTVL